MTSPLIGLHVQALDAGTCEPVTIVTEPQRAADGSWEVLVRFDNQPDCLRPLPVHYIRLRSAAPPSMADLADDRALEVQHPHPGLLKLARYGAAMLHAHRGDDPTWVGDIDGGTAQDEAVRCGVLEARTVTEPCGESCVCAGVIDFPGECFFVAEDVQRARDALDEQ